MDSWNRLSPFFLVSKYAGYTGYGRPYIHRVDGFGDCTWSVHNFYPHWWYTVCVRVRVCLFRTPLLDFFDFGHGLLCPISFPLRLFFVINRVWLWSSRGLTNWKAKKVFPFFSSLFLWLIIFFSPPMMCRRWKLDPDSIPPPSPTWNTSSKRSMQINCFIWWAPACIRQPAIDFLPSLFFFLVG